MLLAILRLAARNLRRNRNRTLVAMLTVACGIVAFLLAGGFISWIFHDMREGTIHSQLGHVQIVRPGYFDKGVADPYAYLLPPDAALPPSIRQLPGVRSVTARLAFSGLASHGDATVAFVGEGIDPLLEKPLSSRITIMSGSDLVSANQQAVLLGEGLARSLEIRAGDSMVLLVTSATGSPNAVEVKVAGTFATIYKDYDDVALRLPIAVARKLMRVQGATSWVMLLDKAERTEATVGLLRAQLAANQFQVVPWSDLADFYNKTVVLFSKQVSVVKFIIGLIIVLTISNTQTMGVLERTREIGTSLAIGQKRRLVLQMFIAEGVLIGVLGGLLGTLLGYLLALLISAVGIPMPPPPGMAHGYIAHILVTRALATDAVVLALLTTLIASLLPAWKASRLNIVDALRYSQ